MMIRPRRLWGWRIPPDPCGRAGSSSSSTTTTTTATTAAAATTTTTPSTAVLDQERHGTLTRPTPAHTECIEQHQLRHPAEVHAIGARCRHGHPQAFVWRLRENTLPSQVVRLSCPLLCEAIDQWEREGAVKQLTRDVQATPVLMDAWRRANMTHAQLRKRVMRELNLEEQCDNAGDRGGHAVDTGGRAGQAQTSSSLEQRLASRFGQVAVTMAMNSGVAGLSPSQRSQGDVKCVHAHVGHYLCTGENDIGKWMLQQLAQNRGCEQDVVNKRRLLLGLVLVFLAVDPTLSNHAFAAAAHVPSRAHGKTAPGRTQKFLRRLEEEDTKVAVGLQTHGHKISPHKQYPRGWIGFLQTQAQDWIGFLQKQTWVILCIAGIAGAGLFTKYLIKSGYYGKIPGVRGEFGGHGEPYGQHSTLTRDFYIDTNIALVAFSGLTIFMTIKELRYVVMSIREHHLFHGNEDGNIGLDVAGEILCPMFNTKSLNAFVQTEGENRYSISFVMNADYLPKHMVAPTLNHPDIGPKRNQLDVPLTEQMWLQKDLEGYNVDTLRLLIRYFYVDKYASKVLNVPMDNEEELLDLAWEYSAYQFKRSQIKECIERGITDVLVNPETGKVELLKDACAFYQFKNDTDPDKYRWAPETKGDFTVVGVVKKDKAWVLNEARELPDTVEAIGKDLTEKLKNAWANLKRYNGFIESREGGRAFMERAEELTSIALVILGVLPEIRSYTAADPECQYLMSKRGRILQGVPRHGPTDKTMPTPEIYNAVGWDCGNNVMVKPVGDITCTLLCKPGYGPSYGNTYCRNLGGVGTEWTHLCTGDGLPIAHTALISPQCCISSPDAPTLSNYTVEEQSDGTYKFSWSYAQGFGYSCGQNQAILMSVCRAPSSNSRFDNARLCTKVCDGAAGYTSGRCSKKSFLLGDRDFWSVPWDEVEDKGTHEDFKARTVAANYAVDAGEGIGSNVDAPDAISGGDTLLYRLSIADNVYARPSQSVWYESEPTDDIRDRWTKQEAGGENAVFPKFPKGGMGTAGNNPSKERDMGTAAEIHGAIHGPWTFADDVN